jgi:hypothetical protein
MSDDKKSDDDPYWDDDKPIKELMELREKIWKRQREQKLAKQKDEAEKAAKSRRTSSSGAPRSTTERRKDELYYATRKGDLVQKFLTRWWHAYDWPTAQDINGTAPSGYEAMDGFKGVYVCMNTQASVEHPLGKILDLRSKDGNCPSLSNISTKSASEIQALCITGNIYTSITSITSIISITIAIMSRMSLSLAPIRSI